jgi:MFS transporter, FSR family, fosmidomycin resistance protein
VVYAQELMPARVGTVAGLFFGLAFGLGGIGAAVLGEVADATSIQTMFHVSAFLPVIGLLAGFLPHLDTESRRRRLPTPSVDLTGNVEPSPEQGQSVDGH